MPTLMAVTCERYREAASARLDGEPIQLPASALDHHLSTCLDCAAWLESASRIGRSIRVTGHTPPDLSGAILRDVVLPTARIRRRRISLRAALAALGLLQWALAMPALFGDGVGMRMAMHASHESAAWNLALGASFLAVAVRPSRAEGALPILATFVGVLAVLSAGDIVAGLVDGTRLASHLGVVAGLVLVVLTARSERVLPPPGETVGSGSASATDLTSRSRRRGAA